MFTDLQEVEGPDWAIVRRVPSHNPTRAQRARAQLNHCIWAHSDQTTGWRIESTAEYARELNFGQLPAAGAVRMARSGRHLQRRPAVKDLSRFAHTCYTNFNVSARY
jgi:hypothetical protein